MPVQVLIRAAAVFDIDENRTRVALHRLRSKGLVDSEERGSYRVAGDMAAASEETLGWRNALSRVVPWSGSWVGVHTADLPRADKTVARRRDRATQLVGLRDLRGGLLIRPDNLAGGVEDLRARLLRLGLEPTAPVFRMDALGPSEDEARHLWDEMALDELYRQQIQLLTQATLDLQRMPAEQGARLAFQVGGRAVSDIVLDPLLPAPLVEPKLREAFMETIMVFDDVARELWSRVLETDLVLRQSPTLAPATG